MQDFIFSHIAGFVWGLCAFFIFVIVILKKGIKPVVAAIDAREARIARELKESEEAYLKAKALKDQLDQQLRSAEARIAEMMAEARRDGEAQKVKLVEAGRSELDGMRGRALREIEGARQAAIVNLRTEVADIATMVAEKILRQGLDPRRQDQLVAQAIDALQARATASAAKA